MSTMDVFGQHDGAEGSEVRWPLHAAFAITLTGFCAFYATTFVALISIWARTGRYEYAFLIPPVCVALVWLRRESLRNLTASPKPLGLILLGMLCLLWLAGTAAHVSLVSQFVIIAMIPCLVFTFYGSVITRAVMFPLAFLFFAVPFGNFLVRPLQDITAWLSVAALQWTSVPVFLEGHYIMTPASTWHVAEACSGVSFFFATTAFGALYANLFFRSWRRRLTFVILALVTPIIANGLRVFFTILIGEYFGIQYATGTDHMVFGWQFFGTVLVLLFLLGWPWHEMEPATRTSRGAAGHHAGGISPIGAVMLLGASLALLAIAPLWINATAARSVSSGLAEALVLPETLGNLSRVAKADVETGPGTEFRNTDNHARGRYGQGQARVLVSVAIYEGVPSERNELINFGNRVFNPAVWTTTSPSQHTNISTPEGFSALYLAPRRSDDVRWLVWYMYRLGGHTTASKIMVKIWQAWERLLGHAAKAGVVVLASPVVDGTRGVAAMRLSRVAKDLLPWWRQRTSGWGG